MRAGVPAAPWKAMHASGVKTAIGTDNVANNNSYDLFNEMQLLGKLMSYREHEPGAIRAHQMVEMATLGGAQALGLEKQIGSLEPGKRADWIALDLEEIGWAPTTAQDIYTALVYSVCGLHVQDVMVDGKWLLRHGQLTTVDYASARTDLELAFAELQKRRAKSER
jgi:5-methylthioadenosine/S-adenosylhomocysteine deaminase